MQRSSTRWTRRVAPQNGTDLPDNQGRCEQTAFTFNPAAPASDPTVTNVVTLPENIQELAQHWMRTAMSWEGEAPSTSIKTWFVDHHNHQHWICQQPRQVRLYDEIQHWETTLKNAWREYIDPAATCLIQVVTPNPPNTDAETTMHVLLIQRPFEVFSTIVTTVIDVSHAPGGIVMQMAITMHEHLRLENLLMTLGLAGRCLAPGAPMVCQAWYDARPLHIGQPFPARDGQHILIHMHQRPRFQASSQGPVLLRQRLQQVDSGSLDRGTHDGEERLTTDAVAQAQWPSRKQYLSFQPVFRIFDRLDTRFFLPQFDLPEIVHPHIAAEWTRIWWDHSKAGSRLRIYFDGSFHKTPEEGHCQAGAAAAAFLLTEDGWVFAGALSSALPQMQSSYTAELAAALAAHKFAFDLIKIHAAIHASIPEVLFCYDALTIGHQAQGDWSSVSHPTFGRCLRDMGLLLASQFQAQVGYQHIYGHTGEPGNELVDCLANSARQHGGWTPFADWVNDMTKADVVAQMDWLWILFCTRICWTLGRRSTMHAGTTNRAFSSYCPYGFSGGSIQTHARFCHHPFEIGIMQRAFSERWTRCSLYPSRDCKTAGDAATTEGREDRYFCAARDQTSQTASGC